MSNTPIMPAQATAADGSPRRVGVEIEFAGLDCRRAAEILAAAYGGTVSEVDPYRHIVETQALGRFVVELDTQFVHPGEGDTPEDRAELERARLSEALETGLRSAVGEITRLYLPVEVVCPPLPVADLAALETLVARLRAAGARGTRDSVAYAFGLQLNVDPPALDAETLLVYLRAYLVVAPWLREVLDVDLTRRVLPFIDPFPRSYIRRVLDPAYAPDLGGLIGDYLDENATRNRELDLLPLFAWLAPDRVMAAISDPRLKPRPALHYRLPDSRLDDPAWGVVSEWNRWAESVEALADDPARLDAAAAAYREAMTRDPLSDWAERVLDWLRS